MKCYRAGGRIKRVSGPNKEHGLKKGEYVNYCFKDGESHRGHVKKKGEKTRKGKMND